MQWSPTGRFTSAPGFENNSLRSEEGPRKVTPLHEGGIPVRCVASWPGVGGGGRGVWGMRAAWLLRTGRAGGSGKGLKTSELAVVRMWAEVCCCEPGDGVEPTTPFQGMVTEDLGTNPRPGPMI